jgi:hypothetical protein
MVTHVTPSNHIGFCGEKQLQGAANKILEFFDIDSLIHHQFILVGESVTDRLYVQVLQRLHNAVKRKWHDKWLLHHNNALSHTLLVMLKLLSEKNIPIITHPPYSLDLTPSENRPMGDVLQPWRISNQM